MIKELITRSRSCRRFDQSYKIDQQILRELVDLARLSPSAANLQPLKYILSRDDEKNGHIFPHLGWAGYLEEWSGPSRDERPTAYIIVLGDTTITRSFGCDHGIAAQSILLGAAEKGLSGCIIGSVDRGALREALQIPAHLEVLLIIALGKPREEPKIEQIASDGDIRYWRDEQGVHHVPKRSLDEIIIE